MSGHAGAAVSARGTTCEILRCEFLCTTVPVEQCALVPFVVIRLPDGSIKSNEWLEDYALSHEAQDSQSAGSVGITSSTTVNGYSTSPSRSSDSDRYTLEYQWQKCTWALSCAQRDCGRPAVIQFAPLLKFAQIQVSEQMQSEDRAALCEALNSSRFCSEAHMHSTWQTLRALQFAQTKAREAIRQLDIDSRVEIIRMAFNPPPSSSTGNPGHASKQNHASNDPQELILQTFQENRRRNVVVGKQRVYVPVAEDIGCTLQLAVRCHSKQTGAGAWMSVDSERVLGIPAGPPRRDMLVLVHDDSLPGGLQLHSIDMDSATNRYGSAALRLVSYNCLAEIYTQGERYDHCPSWALAWSYRCVNLLRELSQYDSDVYCLQEIQEDQYESDIKPAFERLGYAGLFKAKTREPMGRKGKVDGCATFYRTSRLELLENHTIEYDNVARQLGDPVSQARLVNRFIRGNVGMATMLRKRDGACETVCVANTHIYWDPEKQDVKIFQVQAFLHMLSELNTQCPIILAGDFNSEPDSDVYELINTGMVRGPASQAKDPYNVLPRLNLYTGLPFQSAYAQTLGEEPMFTNYTAEYRGTLDYIWFLQAGIRVRAVLRLPDEAELVGEPPGSVVSSNPAHLAIPNTVWSSDHCALAVDFELL
ncbi:Carbon catabolite repressor protein 4-like 1 [Porphyridium purpureum]|uniref:Carbon catabolite repressor protein 4-like 1 n=1 Tax=Porphyridium purpureum TaxID=35688 RepID=A0A5J4Z676_PORPP|nr:Carbon catabolite repressor protein 4-like 1 [Porphyridium purpureum]|eukprot:POR5184..scf295_1